MLYSTYQTAHVGLHHRAGLGDGEWLLVHGAASGVGAAAVELGVAAGAWVIATAGGPQKTAYCRALGAHVVLDHRDADVHREVMQLTDGAGVDVAFDPVGGALGDVTRRVMAWEGRLLVIGFASGDIPSYPGNHVLVKNYSVIGLHWGRTRATVGAMSSRPPTPTCCRCTGRGPSDPTSPRRATSPASPVRWPTSRPGGSPGRRPRALTDAEGAAASGAAWDARIDGRRSRQDHRRVLRAPSLRAGERIALHSSSHVPGRAALDVVRLVCGDPTRSGPGFEERPVTSRSRPRWTWSSNRSPAARGEIDLGGLRPLEQVVVGAHLLATRPHLAQTAWAVLDGRGRVLVAVGVDGGRLVVTAAGAASAGRAAPIEPGRWYRLELTVSVARSDVIVSLVATTSRSPARDLLEAARAAAITVPVPAGWDGATDRCLLGRDPSGSHFDGRLGGLSLEVDGETRRWDLSRAMDNRTIVEVGGLRPDGTLHQLPARAVTGSRWDGSVQAWTAAPEQYAAIHFHHDDLVDAGWEPTATVRLPGTLPRASTASS